MVNRPGRLMRYRNTVHNYLFGPDSQTYKGEMPENVSTVYIRLGCFLYLTAIYLWAIIRMRSYLDNIIYLTMIGYFITWLYFGLTMQRYLMDVMNRGNQRKYTAPSLRNSLVLLFQCSLDIEIPITIVFWSVLFRLLLESPNITTESILMNTNLHLGPLVCILIEFPLNAYTFSPRHLIPIILLGTGYMVINLIYSLAVKPVYQPINWVSLLSYGLIIGCYGLVIVTHYLAKFVVTKFKLQKFIQQNDARSPLLHSLVQTEPPAQRSDSLIKE